jgi:16S rRNA (adenine1518-N6/adenine1519-N6)-dimethyltransferase
MGALTGRLLESGAKVVAIEFDRDMVEHLRRKFAGSGGLTIVQADVLTTDLASILPASGAKLVANLPYYISTPILQRLGAERERFSSMVLMFQKEVVDRILAKPGSSDRGYLTVIVENAFTVERLFDVSPDAFEPRPKVESSVVRLTPRLSAVDSDALEALLSIAFMQKRKTIFNNLKAHFSNAGSALSSAGIDPKRRAETLTLQEWADLVKALK